MNDHYIFTRSQEEGDWEVPINFNFRMRENLFTLSYSIQMCYIQALERAHFGHFVLYFKLWRSNSK